MANKRTLVVVHFKDIFSIVLFRLRCSMHNGRSFKRFVHLFGPWWVFFSFFGCYIFLSLYFLKNVCLDFVFSSIFNFVSRCCVYWKDVTSIMNNELIDIRRIYINSNGEKRIDAFIGNDNNRLKLFNFSLFRSIS